MEKPAFKELKIDSIQHRTSRGWLVGRGSYKSAEVFFKAARDVKGKERLQGEWRNLEIAERALSDELRKSLIKRVDQFEEEGWFVNVYKYEVGKKISALGGKEREEALKSAVEWIVEVGASTAKGGGRAVLEHGDFTVGNLIWNKDSKALVITDWEMMSEKGLPMYDLVDLVVSGWLSTIKGKLRVGLRGFIDGKRDVLQEYLERVGVDRDMMYPLIVRFFKIAADREAELDKKKVEDTLYYKLLKKAKYG